MNPDKYTIKETHLNVGDGHKLYVQDWGNEKSVHPIIFLHGGPGSGCNDKHKKFFDPSRQRVIFFDQRGSGQSTPYGELNNNTTDDLVEDINKIADHLKLEKFILVGGSWGSCLALAHAIKYPKRVSGLVLRGIFTGSRDEINWINKGEFRTFYPEVWQKYLDDTPVEFHDDPSSYHLEQIQSSNSEQWKKSAYAMGNMECGVMTLDDRFTPDEYETYDPVPMIIEMTYMKNTCYMPDRYIIENAEKITAPVWLIQGRYDMVCPPKTAFELKDRIKNCELIWTISGHASEHETWNLIKTIAGGITN